jgi:L-aspartate oxidase
VYDAKLKAPVSIQARATLLATGGLGRIFLNTTNPEVATGDGVAMAYRAGAEVADIEFVQFHPTALHVEGAPRFLLSEALRGEGALLRNEAGERFMQRYHPLLELAPRDVVARAIVAEMKRSGTTHVYLDLSDREPGFVRKRFPRIYETCLRYGIDLERQAAPVAPAAHYAMGGVWTDLDGRTTIERLFAAGEVACTGVHGANRLASNSLLEGVVFGARAGRAMQPLSRSPLCETPSGGHVPESGSLSEVQRIAWEKCGIIRDGAGLLKACRSLEPLGGPAAEVAMLIARCALAREESRGAHYREDFPEKRPEFAKHSVVQKDAGISFR